MLEREEILRRLMGFAGKIDLEIRETVGSTNTVVKELAEQGAPEGTVLIADRQTAGRGRLGRSFHSPSGTGLYMSILLRPGFSAEDALSITTAAAVAVAAAVEKVTGETAKIKWVNDVYLRGRKICGILTEAAADLSSGGLRYAVLGIGVNVLEPEGGFPEEISDVAGALFAKAPETDVRAALAAEILNFFWEYYKALPVRTFLSEYKRRSLLTGMEIAFTRGNEQSRGTVLGIDDKARLLVELDNGGTEAFSAGEVQIDKDFLTRLRQQEADGLQIDQPCDRI